MTATADPAEAQCRDFCLWPYAPPLPPLPDALDGAAPLLAAADAAGCGAEWRDLVAALRAALGPYATVWGVKWDGARLAAELYFYDYARQGRRVSLARVLAALGPFLSCPVRLDDALPYFMVSLDLPMAPGGFPARLEAVDAYLGNPGSTVSSGICYRVAAGQAELKNFYFFFDRRREWDAALEKLRTGMRVAADPGAVDRLLPAWLSDCRTVVVANKRQADALYVSGIDVAQLQRYLREHRHPPALVEHLGANAPRYRHLLFDVGCDLVLEHGRVVANKSSFYGVF